MHSKWLYAVVLASALRWNASWAIETVSLSDSTGLVAFVQQGWGEMGINVAAHQAHLAGEPLKIGTNAYSSGLGHHAPGRMVVALDGAYETFQSEVGLQPCVGGSVVFQVYVDGELKFDSGTMRSGEPAKAVRVNVANASELCLDALDGGDGMACDMANWCNARLTRSGSMGKISKPALRVDIAPFARVMKWDPNRTNGATASRIEEFRAEDLFTGLELKPNRNGTYTLDSDRVSVGLQWLEQRHIRELRLEAGEAAEKAPVSQFRVEAWSGESAWQGSWRALKGEFEQDAAGIVFLPLPESAVHTRKIRWILPAGQSFSEVKLSAWSRSFWTVTNVVVQYEGKPGRSTVAVYNGQLATGETNLSVHKEWRSREPVRFRVVYSRPSMFSDSTRLQFKLPTGEVSVAIADVLSNDCVYLPDLGLFVARDPSPVTLEAYKRQIAGRQTVLQKVREMPDQTLASAMEKTHRDYQRLGPVLLSLACDNSKFLVEREGAIAFQFVPYDWSKPYEGWSKTAYRVEPKFGAGARTGFERRLEGGWLPIVVNTVVEQGIRYTQTTFAAPLAHASEAGRPNKSSACISEFSITNEQSQAAVAKLGLKLTSLAGAEPKLFQGEGGTWKVNLGNKTVAFLRLDKGAKVVLAEAVIEYALEPGQFSKTVLVLPGEGVDLEQLAATAADPEGAKLRTQQYWRQQISQGMHIETPEAWLNDVIRSSVVRCLINARNEADGQRIAASIAAMSYGPLESEAHAVIRGMDFMGQHEFARRSLDFFIHRYNTNGFLTTGYTTFGTAWHLWTLAEHYSLSRDREWLRRAAPELARVCQWIVQQTEKTKQLDAFGKPVPEYGLMPPGVLADWNAFAFHYTMNGYYAAALNGIGQALADVGHPDARGFRRKGRELERNTLRAYAWTQARSPALALKDGTWVKHYPSQVHSPGKLADFFPGQDGGRSWCYDVELGAHQLVPTGVLNPMSREVTQMLDHMEDVQFLADGWFDYPAKDNHADWFNLGGFSKVQPYYTRNAEIYALCDDVKPFIRSYFNPLAAMISPEVLTMWEHFHNVGAFDKTHETGYFLHQTRTMFVQERGDALWLAPFVPSEWLENGRRVVVANAPTRFGAVGFEITSNVAQGIIRVRLQPPAKSPAAVIVRLRHPDQQKVVSVESGGKPVRGWAHTADTIRIPSRTGDAEFLVHFTR